MAVALDRPGRERDRSLDALRGIAVLAVLGYHCFFSEFDAVPATSHFYALAYVFRQGNSGVSLFFLLSALVLTRKYGAQKWTPRDAWLFLRKRFTRIAPLFYASLGVVFVCFFTHVPTAYQQHIQPGFISLLMHGLFLSDWLRRYQNSLLGVGWSLSVEFSFYLAAPLLWQLGHHINWSSWTVPVVSVLLTAWCMAVVYLSTNDTPYTIFVPSTQAAAFGIGMWLANHRFHSLPRWLLRLLIAVLIGIWLLPLPDFAQPLVMPSFYLGLVYVWKAADIGGKVVAVLAWVGQRSFSFYLDHWLIIILAFPVLHRMFPSRALDDLLLLLLVLVPGAALAELTFRVFERGRRVPATVLRGVPRSTAH